MYTSTLFQGSLRKVQGATLFESKEAWEGRDGEARQEGQIPGSDEILEVFRIALGFSEPRLDMRRSRLAFETRAWGLRLRWSELWRSLKVITILGLFSGIWLFLGGDSTCFLLRLRFLRDLDDRVFHSVPSLRWSPCFHQFHIASFRFYERISQRNSRFLRAGWFTSTSCAHTVFIAGFDNQPIRFSISIWPLLESNPMRGEIRTERVIID